MSHVPTELDIKTDLIRCVMASFSANVFEDENCKVFLAHAQKNLGLLKPSKLGLVKLRLKKACDEQNPVNKRREDLLTAAALI